MKTSDGQEIPTRIRYGSETEAGRAAKPTQPMCHDCGAEQGDFHHLGCDMERCALCHEQLAFCACQQHRDAIESYLCQGFYSFDTEPLSEKEIAYQAKRAEAARESNGATL